MTDTKTRLEEINKELEGGKLSDIELDALLDEVQEISAKERKNIEDLMKPFKQKFPLKFVLKGFAYAFLLFTVGIHAAKLVWYFVLLNWNLW